MDEASVLVAGTGLQFGLDDIKRTGDCRSNKTCTTASYSGFCAGQGCP